MWLSGQVAFEIPGLSVPITLQSMLAILLPLCLAGRYASGGILLWLILGALGMNVFAESNGGYAYFYSNSGGYLLGFYIIAILTGKIKDRIPLNWLQVGLLFMLMHALLIGLGLTWIWVDNYGVITMDTHLTPYLPGLFVKCFIGTLIFAIFTGITNKRSSSFN